MKKIVLSLFCCLFSCSQTNKPEIPPSSAPLGYFGSKMPDNTLPLPNIWIDTRPDSPTFKQSLKIIKTPSGVMVEDSHGRRYLDPEVDKILSSPEQQAVQAVGKYGAVAQ